MMHIFDSPLGINIFDAQKFFGLIDTVVSQRNRTKFFIHTKIRALVQCQGNFSELFIQPSGSARLSRDNERRSRFVNKNGVHFINDGVVVLSLREIRFIVEQIVTQIIEAELIIGAVSDISLIGLLFSGWS